ncbi:hypothetical protein L484_017030 [Morus notabilis]|uniref:Uncharacterized protein n=1 Tax=Morus notabilis TaxID=981085 RepID=W9SAE9_9ROSA|nr:hypothetical protein L484_017030 [Morus notabilis]
MVQLKYLQGITLVDDGNRQIRELSVKRREENKAPVKRVGNPKRKNWSCVELKSCSKWFE